MDDDAFNLWRQDWGKKILFFDGASKGNLGETSVGGVLYDSDGVEKLTIAWGLGHSSKNQVEALVVFMGLKLLRA